VQPVFAPGQGIAVKAAIGAADPRARKAPAMARNDRRSPFPDSDSEISPTAQLLDELALYGYRPGQIYAGPRHEVGAGWSQVAKSSGETYINLKIGSPEFGPNWVRCRLVKLEKPAEDGATHIALWEPRD
jgi:hypothetical protein